ncbi:TetR/AcrR family transcriptional regulator [Psittacicella gerlachiana]|uniref:HTH tetR-type domain-containing protein n=1 Tax=Psittacicella gerlachiana TaxID=2028574 RepID=A0A3A1YB79_9GAMM|nr:TetR/AcrR family transcriptional regulator [Psittacicella gerlachiana]RIY35563.1 hypothetical protein CKF59_03505 [Psittacicella gerlachiana]
MKQGEETKNYLIAVGKDLIAHKGFTAVGLNEILTTANVPKGSFYHYFSSKEVFGLAILEAYFTQYLEELKQLFNTSESFEYKVLTYWQQWQEREIAQQGCLIVKLSAEISDLSEVMRASMQRGLEAISEFFWQQIKLAQAQGELSSQVEAEELTAFLFQNWLGACLSYKINRPLTRCFTLATQHTQKLLELYKI